MLQNTFVSSRRHAVTTNDTVLQLAERGRSHRCSTGCPRVCCVLVGHLRISPVWRDTVTAANDNNNNLVSSDIFQ